MLLKFLNFALKKANRKVLEEPTSRHRSQVLKPGGREKETQLTNKCTINTKTSSLFPKQGDQNAKRAEEVIDNEQGKTKHKVPHSVNYRATENKNNIGTTALERSVVYTTPGGGGKGVKGLSMYKLHPGSRYNSYYKKYIKSSVGIMAS